MQTAFGKGKALFNIHQHDDDGQHLTIEISVHNDKLDAFWTGEWASVWTLENGQITGTLKVRSHYFEMGNMQFNLDKKFDNVACKDSSSAKEIVKAIKKTEDKVSNSFFQFIFSIFFDSIKVTQRTCTITFKKTYLKELEDLSL